MLSHRSALPYQVDPLLPRLPMSATEKQSYMVIDTGCERMTAGNKWHQSHSKRMSLINLQPYHKQESEQFVFGDGVTHTSLARVTSPGAVQHVPFLFRYSLLANVDVPLLSSKGWMRLAGCVIDLGLMTMTIRALHVSFGMSMLENGHLAVRID